MIFFIGIEKKYTAFSMHCCIHLFLRRTSDTAIFCSYIICTIDIWTHLQVYVVDCNQSQSLLKKKLSLQILYALCLQHFSEAQFNIWDKSKSKQLHTHRHTSRNSPCDAWALLLLIDISMWYSLFQSSLASSTAMPT